LSFLRGFVNNFLRGFQNVVYINCFRCSQLSNTQSRRLEFGESTVLMRESTDIPMQICAPETLRFVTREAASSQLRRAYAQPTDEWPVSHRRPPSCHTSGPAPKFRARLFVFLLLQT
jgi:hypothetical protein